MEHEVQGKNKTLSGLLKLCDFVANRIIKSIRVYPFLSVVILNPMALKKITDGLIDFVLPPRCPITGDKVNTQGALSAQVWRDLTFIEKPYCVRCGIPFAFVEDIDDEDIQCGNCISDPPHYSNARAGVVYDDVSRDLILGYKHADKIALVLSFRPWIKRAGSEMLKEADAILPVPLHPWRLLGRRYNQAALLAKDIEAKYKVPAYMDVLLRKRHTPSQGYKNTDQRIKNVKSAFKVQKLETYNLISKKIVLIDDVFTTGATANECAKTLLKAGIAKVNVLTLARVARI